ncbi:MAG: pyruvate kinase [Chitinophagales bacterium]|nr:pyruvate kinase [Chitinophagales bacterium]MCB9031719.1 pyruvate kinase [Chitinophagales bacterium]HPE96567.1 pyruvate kinase [Chitinophagales bacterium]HRX24563.1 pyruvate kinase [Chitinophagales bacterium]
MTRHDHRTKIIATLGPASGNEEMIRKLVQSGVDVFRLNMSHGDHAYHKKTIKLIRKINKDLGTYVAILADLQGPKIRLGMVEENLPPLKKNAELIITTKELLGNNEQVYITYPAFAKDVEPGDTILIDDGKIEGRVLTSNKKDKVTVRIIHPGVLSSRKGVNLPDTNVSIPSLTEKDHEDLLFALENGAHWVALSFVRKAEDIIHLKNIIRKHGKLTKVIAKIEKPEGFRNIDAIIDATDAVMVARGDLGVEMPVENVPFIQKSIVTKCGKKAKPVIIATQMMESMIEQARPTRAEVTDVANAVMDGADAVMLSGETAMGQHPELVVKTMSRIINKAEKEDIIYNRRHVADPKSRTFLSDAVCYNSCNMADEVGARAIMGMTKTGYTAFMVSSSRPRAAIYIFTNNQEIVNTLNLLWGVKAFYYTRLKGTYETFMDVQEVLKGKKLLQKGDIVLNLGTMPVTQPSRTNVLRISIIE